MAADKAAVRQKNKNGEEGAWQSATCVTYRMTFSALNFQRVFFAAISPFWLSFFYFC